MFATLVVCIPCKHSGGDVELSFRSKKRILSTAAYSDWFVSYLAWYADVLHEVKPVISGHRIVLTFNLVRTETTVLKSLTAYDDHISRLRPQLKQWSDTTEKDSCFIHLNTSILITACVSTF